jgi:polyisoprenoid-binding protein YceI
MQTIAIAAGVLGLGAVGLGALTGMPATVETREIAAATSQESASVQSWALDRVHSTVLFKTRHAGVANFYGVFKNFDATIKMDPADPTTGSIEFTVQVESVDTRNAGRDDHLRNADFFNARQFPTATFKSTGITKSGENYKLTGDLTLYGKTNTITADLYDIRTGTFRNNRVMGFEATFDIKRTDFGMNTYVAPDGSENGGLGNTVTITVAVEAAAAG